MSKILSFNNKLLANPSGSHLLGDSRTPDPYNPYDLPAGTIRYKFDDLIYDPSHSYSYAGGTWTRVSSTQNIWDWSIDSNPSLSTRFTTPFGVPTHIIGANFQDDGISIQPSLYGTWQANTSIVSVAVMDTRTITDFQSIFSGCTNLTTLAGFPINHRSYQSFYGCTSLKHIPVFEIVDSRTDVSYMFMDCYNVDSGILECYNNFATRAFAGHFACFRDCGRDSVTGSAELAQIPNDWK